MLFIFAGKAHPADEPGRHLIRQIAELARQREFEGRILLVEGYDLHLARRMVSGVDVWLNNPIYPLEASGTSGMKAAINGAINLSVLDGWWGEGYDGKNGWAIKPAADGLDPAQRDIDEARTLYELLQDSVIPMYYRNTSLGYSPEWVAMAKALDRFDHAPLQHAAHADRLCREVLLAGGGAVAPILGRQTFPAPAQWPTGRRGYTPPGRASGCAASTRPCRASATARPCISRSPCSSTA